MKTLAMIAVVLTVVAAPVAPAAQTAAHTVAGVLPSGYGCMSGTDVGDFLILIEFNAVGQTPTKGKVQYIRRVPYPNQSAPVCASNGRATGDDDFRIQTANNLLTFKIVKFDTELVVSSPGSCGKPLQVGGDIQATITRTQVTVTCTIGGTIFKASGLAQPPLTFK